MSTRRSCDVISLEPAHLYPWVASHGVVFELIGILTESNVLSFFEYNMRFLCYSAALCFQINRFQSEGQA